MKGSQLLEPLFEFSGACAGCGETPYLKLMSQLFGDRAIIANATGCSSIYGGNLPTTPWTNERRRARAGLVQLAVRGQRRIRAWAFGWRSISSSDYAEYLVEANCADSLGERLSRASARRRSNERSGHRRSNASECADLKQRLDRDERAAGARAASRWPMSLVRRSVWIVGGDGWAYDIGFGGLDHVLTTGRDVNILVLDTGVYSNTGGQASKATPRAAVAKFAANGKQRAARKIWACWPSSYGNVYVAQIAMGANPKQTMRAFLEAESYPGPSLILAYSQCIAHGINMTHGDDASEDGRAERLLAAVPLRSADRPAAGEHPFHLDSRKPTIPFREFAMQEARFAMLRALEPGACRASC